MLSTLKMAHLSYSAWAESYLCATTLYCIIFESHVHMANMIYLFYKIGIILTGLTKDVLNNIEEKHKLSRYQINKTK